MDSVFKHFVILVFSVFYFFPTDPMSAPYEIGSGEVIKISVSAEVNQAVFVPTEKQCLEDISIEGCDLLVPFEGNPRHFCEDHPDARGCKFYKPEE